MTSGIDSDAVATARQWLEDAAGQAIVLKQDLLAAARTAGRRILAASSSGFHETKVSDFSSRSLSFWLALRMLSSSFGDAGSGGMDQDGVCCS